MDAGEKRDIRDSYDNLGGRLYDIRYLTEQEAKYRKILDNISLSNESITLDVGCGTGLLLKKLRNYAIGLDFSSELLSKARSRLRKKSSVHLIQADSERLPIRGGIFDSVFSVTLIQNSPNPVEVLKEIKRVSRVSSEIAVTALKKSFTPDSFRSLIVSSGLNLKALFQDEYLKDWIAFASC